MKNSKYGSDEETPELESLLQKVSDSVGNQKMAGFLFG